MTRRIVTFELVKMEGDFVTPTKWWQVHRKLLNKIRGKREMPADPRNHPDCFEILESRSEIEPARPTHRRTPCL